MPLPSQIWWYLLLHWSGPCFGNPCRSSLPIVLNDCCKAIYFNSRPFAHILQGAPFDQAKQDVKQATASLHRCNLRWRCSLRYRCNLKWSNQQSSQACSMLIAPPWLHLSHHLKARPVHKSKERGIFWTLDCGHSSGHLSGLNVQSPATMTTWEVNISDETKFRYKHYVHSLEHKYNRRRIATSWQRASWVSHHHSPH